MYRITIYDKRDWQKGPWQEEADHIRWIDKNTNFPCVMYRSPETGAWVSLVGLPPDHPLYLVDRDDMVFRYIAIHNGISFTGSLIDEDLFFYPPICRWWIGYHLMGELDFKPKIVWNRMTSKQYRNEEFVIRETIDLADQLYKMYDSPLFEENNE